MRLIITIAFSFYLFISFSQSHTKNTLSINAGFDGGIHRVVSKTESGGVASEDTSAAATTLFRADAHYNFLNWLSAGIFVRTGSYLEDPDNAESNGNHLFDYNLGVRVYPVNKDKFALYFGLYFGGSKLAISRIYSNSILADYKWKGSNFSADFGFNWYFVKNVGLNFSMGYSGHKYNLDEFSINSTPQNLTNTDHSYTTKGFHICIGVAVHLFGE